jgi:cytochrome c553
MAEELTETAANNGVQVAMSDHGFEVGSKVCIRCHGAEPERQSSAGGSRLLAAARDPDTATDLQATRIAELEQQVHAEKSATARVRSAAAIGFGLALGAGGFFGLVVGLGAVVLLRRRQS